MRQVRHAGPPEGAEWAPPGDCEVCKRGGEKETAAGRDRDEGLLRTGFRSIRGTHQVVVGVQIPGDNLDRDRRRLAGGGRESKEGKGKFGTAGQGA